MPLPISIAINKPQVMPTIMFFPTFNLEYVSHDLGLILFTWKINQGLLHIFSPERVSQDISYVNYGL